MTCPNRAGTKPQKAPQQILRERLIDPLRPSLQGIEMLLVSPDGALNQIPLAALPGEKGKYLLEELPIAIVPVPRELPGLLKTNPVADASRKPSLLLVGTSISAICRDPCRSPRRRSPAGGSTARPSVARGCVFKPLPGTRDEIVTIGNTFRNRFGGRDLRVLTKSEATAEAFRVEAPRRRWLHLATHGFFAPESIRSASIAGRTPARGIPAREPVSGRMPQTDPALLSGIAFAGASRTGQPPAAVVRAAGREMDDGILTALEVSELICGMSSWPSSPPARRAWVASPVAKACSACSVPFKRPAHGPPSQACGKLTTRPPRY